MRSHEFKSSKFLIIVLPLAFAMILLVLTIGVLEASTSHSRDILTSKVKNDVLQTDSARLIWASGQGNHQWRGGRLVTFPEEQDYLLDDGTVSGHLYIDRNGNGTQDGGDTDLPNVDVIITASNGTSQTVTTDNQGDWIATVPPGNTTVDVDEDDPDFPSGYTQTEGEDPTIVEAVEGEDVNAGNDGYYLPGTVSGHLYIDSNGNGKQNGGEADLPDIDVVITDSNANSQTVTTDNKGDWIATVPPGSTTVDVDEDDPDFPAGCVQTEGDDPTILTAVAGQEVNAGNDGYQPRGTVSGRIFEDLNGNGQEEIDEPGLVNVKVVITESHGVTQTVSSNVTGNYSATVPAGSTTADVDESTLQAGYVQTAGSDPSTVSAVTGEDTKIGVDGYQKQADLSLEKGVNNATPFVGTTVLFTLRVDNEGPAKATGVLVDDKLPSGYEFVGAVGDGSYSSSTGVWTIGQIANSDYAELVITAKVNASGDYSNEAQISKANEHDPDPGNNQDIAATTPIPVAELKIKKVDSPDPVAAGANLTYTVTITNDGPSSVKDVVMTDQLPDEVTFLSVIVTPISRDDCEENSGVLTCQLGDFQDQDNAIIQYVVHVDPSTDSPTINNSASVSGDDADPSFDSRSTEVRPEADLFLTKKESSSPVTAGESLTYTLTVKNNGPADAREVAINDTLPLGVTYQSSSGCTVKEMLVTCELGTVLANETKQKTIKVKVSPGARTDIVNSATVLTAESIDPDSSNNTAIIATPVIARADLSISKSVLPDQVEVGGTVTYTLAINNNGPSLATGVRVVDDLPSEVSLISATPSKGTCKGSSSVTCELGNLNVNQRVTITIVVEVETKKSSSIRNSSQVSSSVLDPNVQDNSDTASTDVFEFIHKVFVPIIFKLEFGEQNDTCETAAPISTNINFSFLPEDIFDWYRFTLSSSGKLNVELSNFVPMAGQLTAFRGASCDSRELLGIDGSTATSKVLDLGLQPAGNYYIFVSNDGDPSTIPYTLRVDFKP